MGGKRTSVGRKEEGSTKGKLVDYSEEHQSLGANSTGGRTMGSWGGEGPHV